MQRGEAYRLIEHLLAQLLDRLLLDRLVEHLRQRLDRALQVAGGGGRDMKRKVDGASVRVRTAREGPRGKDARLDVLEDALLVARAEEERHRVRPLEREAAVRQLVDRVLHELRLRKNSLSA